MRHWRLRIDLTDATRVPDGFRSVDARGDLPDHWTAFDLRRAASIHYGLPIESVPEPTIWGRNV